VLPDADVLPLRAGDYLLLISEQSQPCSPRDERADAQLRYAPY